MINSNNQIASSLINVLPKVGYSILFSREEWIEFKDDVNTIGYINYTKKIIYLDLENDSTWVKSLVHEATHVLQQLLSEDGTLGLTCQEDTNDYWIEYRQEVYHPWNHKKEKEALEVELHSELWPVLVCLLEYIAKQSKFMRGLKQRALRDIAATAFANSSLPQLEHKVMLKKVWLKEWRDLAAITATVVGIVQVTCIYVAMLPNQQQLPIKEVSNIEQVK